MIFKLCEALSAMRVCRVYFCADRLVAQPAAVEHTVHSPKGPVIEHEAFQVPLQYERMATRRSSDWLRSLGTLLRNFACSAHPSFQDHVHIIAYLVAARLI